MLPTRTNRRAVIVWIFLASCAISLLSSLFFYAYFGRTDGAVFLQPDRLAISILSDGIGAVLLLAILLPLRSAGPGPFWACGFGALVVLWPPLSEPVGALLQRASGGLAPAAENGTLHDWFYCLLHFPDNLVLVTGSVILLAVVDRLWPAPPPEAAWAPRRYPGSVAGWRAPLSVAEILFAFNDRLNRRPYIVATVAIGLPNTVLQTVVPTDAGLLAQIVLFWPLLALGTKRAHNRGHGADWIVCMLALPGAFGVLLELVVAAEAVKGGLDASTLNLIVALDLLLVLPVLWASVELVFLRGVAGANRFGPDPLAAGRDRRAGADFSDGLRAGAAVVKPLATFPPHVTPEAAARFRQRFKRR